MKAKLIKERDYYNLYRIDEDGKRVTFASTEDYKQKLSKANCDEIFGVVDVEKLAEQEFDRPYIVDMGTNITPAYQDGFKIGFNKAMELMKDKVFTLDDMYDAVMLGVCFENPGIQGISNYNEAKDLAIKRALKPTEIDVEIEMDILNEYDQPKLDSEGCLILTKKI